MDSLWSPFQNRILSYVMLTVDLKVINSQGKWVSHKNCEKHCDIHVCHYTYIHVVL